MIPLQIKIKGTADIPDKIMPFSFQLQLIFIVLYQAISCQLLDIRKTKFFQDGQMFTVEYRGAFAGYVLDILTKSYVFVI